MLYAPIFLSDVYGTVAKGDNSTTAHEDRNKRVITMEKCGRCNRAIFRESRETLQHNLNILEPDIMIFPMAKTHLWS